MLTKILISLILLIVTSPAYAQTHWDKKYWKGGGDWGNDSAANFPLLLRYLDNMGYTTFSMYNANAAQRIAEPLTANKKFIIIDPEKWSTLYSPYSRSIITTDSYGTASQNYYKANMVIGTHTLAFPDCIAPNWWFSATNFSTIWCYQQESVNETVTDGIMSYIATFVNPATNLSFGGITYDVAKPRLNFGTWTGSASDGLNIQDITGTTSCSGTITPYNHTHNYSTTSDGRAAFYKMLNNKLNNTYGTGTWLWMIEPAYVWFDFETGAWANRDTDEWVYAVGSRTDWTNLKPDIIGEETGNLTFATQNNNFNAPLSYARDRLASAANNQYDESKRRNIAAHAFVYGSWNMHSHVFSSPSVAKMLIGSVSASWKMAKEIPNWLNIRQVPVSRRGTGTVDGTITATALHTDGSIDSQITKNVYQGWHPDRQDIFACVLTDGATITVRSGQNIIRVKSIDPWWSKINDITSQFDYAGTVGGTITVANKSSFEIDGVNGTGLIIECGTPGVSVCTY